LCQSIKRAQWQDRLGAKLLAVPYTHTVFTIPHQLNHVAKRYPKQMYNLLLRSAWWTVKQLCADPTNVGALPGMISVLHTFGSDMKYHLHVHSLITFGGLKNNMWVWPKRKKKIAPYRMMCRKFREIFISGLDKEVNTGSIDVTDYEEIRDEISKRRWNVRNSYPTLQTGLIENYLARYINRVAISKNRLKYLESEKQVQIVYSDYRNQQKDQAAPKSIKELSPLVAIHQIIQHLLPPYFQKSRHYGLHSTAIFSMVKGDIPQLLRNVGQTIRTVFQILKDLLKLNPLVCEKCHQPNLIRIPIMSDRDYIKLILTVPKGRPPPLGNKIKCYRS
jgi:hypothetical protein